MFYLKGIPIHFRKLTYDDLKMSYYNLMHLLSDTNIELINTLSLDELFTKLNDDYYIFVIVNIDNDFIIGSGTIKVLNKTYWDQKTGCYTKMLRQSYNSISEEIIGNICKAISTKDSKKIEKAYQEVLEELK